MENGAKKWCVSYAHADGRSGQVEVVTEVMDSPAFHYGNGKMGVLKIDLLIEPYDLRYASGDLHKLMLEEYFGKGLVKAVELS